MSNLLNNLNKLNVKRFCFIILIGIILQMTTNCKKETVVSLNTIQVTEITATSAQTGGVIESDEGTIITERGVVYNTNDLPTIENCIGITSDGNGRSNYISYLINLQPNTIYYVRAYAINEIGTTYGSQISFKTIIDGIPCEDCITIKDIDNNIYNTVRIGSQCWMKENLKTTRYRDESLIIAATDTTLTQMNTGAYAIFQYNSTTYPSDEINSETEMVNAYGLLYNYYAVEDTKGICPEGWHIPSDEEWIKLEVYLGMSTNTANSYGWRDSIVGNKLKSERVEPEFNHPRWDYLNSGEYNHSNFSALPSGGIGSNGGIGLGNMTSFWSSSEYNSDKIWTRMLTNGDGQVSRGASIKTTGRSIRCVKD